MRRRKQGMVSLVGAGPGDPDLITLKGLRRLREADVVVYDRLIPVGLLAHLPAGAERIFAGDRPRGRDRDQARINDLMIARSREGKRVVRLKGGDPFVFGRGGEEASALAEAGIPWEVVPGVTSPIAVLAYAGIPITDRRFSSSFAVVTGNAGARSGQAKAPWRATAGHADTLVCLMATAALSEITADLLADGFDPSTPSAVVQRGTTARQRTVTAPLGEIAERARQAKVRPPSILVVGGVASLADSLAWYERLPLFGLRIGITRASKLASTLAADLADLGAEVVEISVVDPREEDAAALVREILADGLDLICYTSPSAVHYLAGMLGPARAIPSAVAGQATVRAAGEAGLEVVPELSANSSRSLTKAIVEWSAATRPRG